MPPEESTPETSVPVLPPQPPSNDGSTGETPAEDDMGLTEEATVDGETGNGDACDVPTADGEQAQVRPLFDTPPGYRAGYVAVVGRPNVGKSTLINRIVGQKVSIVSDKPQTTRTRLLAICQRPDAQIIFIDTPGIHAAAHRLGELMVRSAQDSLHDADVVLFLADAGRSPNPEDAAAAQAVRLRTHAPVLLILNKRDLAGGTDLEVRSDSYGSLVPNAERVAVSAKTGDGVDALEERIVALLPESPPFFPPDEFTDQTERAMAAELVREQVLRLTRQEVPHGVAVVVERYEERGEDRASIEATIYVERDSQKGIIIGAGGKMLKSIGQSAREEIEALTERHVYLQLWVKVRKDWRKKDPLLRQMGYGS